MKDISCKLLVIGAGPGGYVCAIRAGQLGIDTVVVEAKKPGGTCLNVGCIPSKALIHAADEFARIAQLRSGREPARHFASPSPQFDLAKTMHWKDGIVGRLSSGVSGLLKKARVKIVEGWARFRDGKTVEVETEIGLQVIRAEQVVIATGSDAVELPFLPFGGPVISSTEALSLTEVPRKSRRGRRRLYRAGTGNRLCQDGRRGDGVEALPRILPQYDAELTRPVGEAPARTWHRRC